MTNIEKQTNQISSCCYYHDPKGNRWIAELGYYIDGKRHRKCIAGKTIDIVNQRIETFKTTMFLNDVSIKEKDLQFKNFALNWIETKLKHKLKPSSYLTKIRTLENYVNPYIGEILIHKLSHKDIQDMINQLTESGLSYSITKKAYEVVTGTLRYYRVLSNKSFNPSEGIELPQNIKPDIANHNYFTAEERKLFEIEAHKTHQNGTPVYRNAPALLFLMYTGLRISEALALTWADIDFEDNSININKSAQYLCLNGKYEMLTQHSTKTASSVRVIPMTQKAREALIELKRMSDGNNVI